MILPPPSHGLQRTGFFSPLSQSSLDHHLLNPKQMQRFPTKCENPGRKEVQVGRLLSGNHFVRISLDAKGSKESFLKMGSKKECEQTNHNMIFAAFEICLLFIIVLFFSKHVYEVGPTAFTHGLLDGQGLWSKTIHLHCLRTKVAPPSPRLKRTKLPNANRFQKTHCTKKALLGDLGIKKHPFVTPSKESFTVDSFAWS